MNLEQRVIYDTTDISKDVNDFRAGMAAFDYVAGKYLYIGCILPFNNLWFESSVPNTTPAVLSVQLWNGSAWINAVDIIDETLGLSASGRIQWVPDIDKPNWQIQQKSEDIAQLSAFKIYNMYWMRFSWDVDFTVGTILDYVGQKFSDDGMLISYYPDLGIAALKDEFEAGKTDWDEQHFIAAEIIIRDLKKNGIIISRAQLLDHSIYADAGCHKVAEIIYTAFGTPYFEQRQASGELYREALNVKYPNKDSIASGRLDPINRVLENGYMTR